MAYASAEGITKALSHRDSSASYDDPACHEANAVSPIMEYDVEQVEKVYRRLDFRIIPGIPLPIPHSHLAVTVRWRIFLLTSDSLLDPVLLVLSYPLQYWAGTDHERRRRP